MATLGSVRLHWLKYWQKWIFPVGVLSASVLLSGSSPKTAVGFESGVYARIVAPVEYVDTWLSAASVRADYAGRSRLARAYRLASQVLDRLEWLAQMLPVRYETAGTAEQKRLHGHEAYGDDSDSGAPACPASGSPESLVLDYSEHRGMVRLLWCSPTVEAGRWQQGRLALSTAELKDAVSRWSESIQARSTLAKPLGSALGRRLLAPVHEHLPQHVRVNVYWHSPLVPIPWAALPSADGQPLAATHWIDWGATLGKERDADWFDDAGLIVSPRGDKGSLRGAIREAHRLRRNSPSVLPLERTFQEDEIERALEKSQWLHLALHTTRDSDGMAAFELGATSPENPFIRGDGRWSEKEIRQRRWPQLELVVLSGCRTVHESRGLAQAFLDAGARQVLGSLWDIDDAVTAEWMRRFYDYLERSKSVRGALASTQRDFANGRISAHFQDPYFWAGFVLVSD